MKFNKSHKNDSNIIYVFNGNIQKAFKQLRVRMNNYGTMRMLKDRAEYPGPNDRKRWKRIRAEKNRLRRLRRKNE